ncbi:MAG: archaellin/type IV pilin N-terminal domain-containing protein, partial [Ignisphaera sp.]
MKHTKIGSAKKARRGIVGIEAAIVLIAFVVVAAALAFVALNMGFYTTQRSKEVMAAGLAQASSSLEVDGSVLAKVDTTSSSVNTTSSSKLTCIVIPIRLSAGQKPVDLTPNKTQIALWVINKEAFTNLYTKQDQAVKTPEDVNSS